MRNASHPYCSTTLIGSMPLSKDFENFSPSLSRNMPCMYASLNGTSFSVYVLIKIMRISQRYKISYPIVIHCVGWNVARSLVFSGQPSVENVHEPELNHVSSVSGSCSQPSPCGALVPTCISSPLYHTGMRCPHQSWRDKHQSCNFSTRSRYNFVNRSGVIVTFLFVSPSNPPVTASRIRSRRLF